MMMMTMAATKVTILIKVINRPCHS